MRGNAGCAAACVDVTGPSVDEATCSNKGCSEDAGLVEAWSRQHVRWRAISRKRTYMIALSCETSSDCHQSSGRCREQLCLVWYDSGWSPLSYKLSMKGLPSLFRLRSSKERHLVIVDAQQSMHTCRCRLFHIMGSCCISR